MSIYDSKEFKKLQMKWYEKLESDGFIDCERSGKKRAKYFDQYGGILSPTTSSIVARYDSIAATYFSILGKFSQDRTFASYFKVKSAYSNEFSHIYIDALRTIAYLYSNGSTIAEISKHLRDTFPPLKRKSRKSLITYSVFWVHSELKKIGKALYKYSSIEENKNINDFIKNIDYLDLSELRVKAMTARQAKLEKEAKLIAQGKMKLENDSVTAPKQTLSTATVDSALEHLKTLKLIQDAEVGRGVKKKGDEGE